MTVLHSGSTKAFASGWELAFSGKKAGKKPAKSKAAGNKPGKSTKKKASKPKATGKPAKKKGKR